MYVTCIVEDCDNPVENRDLGLCASCNKKRRQSEKKSKPKRRKKLKLQSAKHSAEISKYVAIKKEFFSDPKNCRCAVCGLTGADSIHHTKGKTGYADDWARDRGISLLNDTRFWAPIHSFVSNSRLGMPCHQYIETHDEFAREIGLKLERSAYGKSA